MTCCDSEKLGTGVRLLWQIVELLGRANVLPVPNSLAGNECLLSLDIAQRWLLLSPTLLGVDVLTGLLREKGSSISLSCWLWDEVLKVWGGSSRQGSFLPHKDELLHVFKQLKDDDSMHIS